MKIKSLIAETIVCREIYAEGHVTFKRSGLLDGKPVYEADLPEDLATSLIAASPKTFFPFDGPKIEAPSVFPDQPKKAEKSPVTRKSTEEVK